MKKHFPVTIVLASTGLKYEFSLSIIEFEILSLAYPDGFIMRTLLRPPGESKVVVFMSDELRSQLSELDLTLKDRLLYYKYRYYTDPVFWGDSGPHIGQISGFQFQN